MATKRGPSYSGKENCNLLPTDGTDMTLTANPRSLVFWMAYPGPGNLGGASRSLIDDLYLLAPPDVENPPARWAEGQISEERPEAPGRAQPDQAAPAIDSQVKASDPERS